MPKRSFLDYIHRFKDNLFFHAVHLTKKVKRFKYRKRHRYIGEKMKVKSIVLGLFLVSSALVAGFGADNLVAGVDEVVISPPAGSTFTFHVKASGDKAATVSLWQEPGEHDEVHMYVGVIKNVMGKTKDKTVEGSESYDCIKWEITHPDKPDFYANFCYAIENNVLYYYLEEQSSGELKYYVNPLKMISSPLKVGDKYSGNTSFYTNVPDTGVFLAKRYESPDVKRDSIKVDVSIDKKETSLLELKLLSATRSPRYSNHTPEVSLRRQLEP
jgi:hypothetical protein